MDHLPFAGFGKAGDYRDQVALLVKMPGEQRANVPSASRNDDVERMLQQGHARLASSKLSHDAARAKKSPGVTPGAETTKRHAT